MFDVERSTLKGLLHKAVLASSVCGRTDGPRQFFSNHHLWLLA